VGIIPRGLFRHLCFKPHAPKSIVTTNSGWKAQRPLGKTVGLTENKGNFIKKKSMNSFSKLLRTIRLFHLALNYFKTIW
jgi:hypothetical protein